MKDIMEMCDGLGIEMLNYSIGRKAFNYEIEILYYDSTTEMTYTHRKIGGYGQSLEIVLKMLESEIKDGLEKLRGEHEHSR